MLEVAYVPLGYEASGMAALMKRTRHGDEPNLALSMMNHANGKETQADSVICSSGSK